MKRILSLGLGVQSTALYLMSCRGEMPRLDYAIFADLGREKKKTYDYLKWLLEWSAVPMNNGIPIIVVNEKNLYKDLLNSENSTGQRFSSIPAYTKGEDGKTGMMRRQCTGEYKIQQVDNLIRTHIHQLVKYDRLPQTEVWKGISFDEIERMSIPPEAWKIQVYPFVGYKTDYSGDPQKIDFGKQMYRYQIEQWYKDNDFPIPPKSSCVFCPYTSEAAWYDMKINDPDDFEAAAKVDDAIRDSSKKGMTHPIYLHESLQPLREVQFKADAPDLWSGDCSGECHT